MAAAPGARKLHRVDGTALGGVCAGVADYLALDVGIVRMVAVVLCVLTLGIVGLVYVVLWAVLPVSGNATANDAVSVDADGVHSDVYGTRPCPTCPPTNDTDDRIAHAALALGVVVLVVAVAILFSSTTRFFEPLHFWPLAIVAAGVVRMVLPDAEGKRLWPFAAGSGLLVLGMVTLYDSLGMVAVDWTGWLVHGVPLLGVAAILYVVGWYWHHSWAKLAALVLVAVFILMGFVVFLSPGPIQQIPVQMLMRM